MAVGDIYLKYKDAISHRKEICCLQRNLFAYVDQYRIDSEYDESRIPLGYYLLQRIYPKPEIPEGKVKGYHFKIEDGVMKRWYLICDDENDKQLLVVEDYEDAVQKYLDETV